MRELVRRCGIWCYAHRQAFIKYFVTGISSFIIDYGLFLLMTILAGVWYATASAISQAVSIAFNFLVNKHWAFQSRGKTHHEAARYSVILAFNYVVQLGVLVVLVESVHIPEAIAKILSAAVVVLWTFFIYKLWVFRP